MPGTGSPHVGELGWPYYAPPLMDPTIHTTGHPQYVHLGKFHSSLSDTRVELIYELEKQSQIHS